MNKYYDFEIVVSSDWKNWVSLSQMDDFYIDQNIIKTPVDYTKNIFNKYSSLSEQRAMEVKRYIEENNIVDDNKFIHITEAVGLRSKVNEFFPNLV